jgi:hypothetical protein
MANLTLVRQALGPDATKLVVSFAENNVGDTLVAVFAAVAASGDFAPPDAVLNDSNGNPWNLAYSQINQSSIVSGNFTAVAVYVCNRCAASPTVNDLNIPVELIPGDVLETWSYGAEFLTTYATLEFQSQVFQASESANFTLDLGDILTNNRLLMGGTFSSNAGSTTTFFSTTLTALVPNVNTDGEVGYLLNPGAVQVPTLSHVNVAGPTPDAFAFLLLFTGTNSTGGSAAQTLTFSINKGPLPEPPREGRAIATVQVDCSQQPVVSAVNFPELCFLDVTELNDVAGFTVCQFDLEHLFQGSGLSEVRSLMYSARPTFHLTSEGREDVSPSNTFLFPAIITNTTTLQTLTLGDQAALDYNNDIQGCYYQTGVLSFPANKHSLKYRFICPQFDANAPCGKYILQFCNFEVPPHYMQPGKIAQTID